MIRQAASLADADRVLREKGKTFAWARRFLGRRHAERSTRLYAFCRYLDDVADETPDPEEAQQALGKIRADMVRGASADPMVSAVLEVLGGEGPGVEAAVSLIDGVRSDLGEVRLADERALIRYCYRVAGTVGVMMCYALERPKAAALPHAVDLGIGMQLTNIARDLHEDGSLGRRYVPASLVGELHPDDIIAPTDQQLRDLVDARERLLEIANRYYTSGERGLCFLPLRARSAMLVAAECYRAIGSRALALGPHIKTRAFVPTAGKVIISIAALLGHALRPSFWRRPLRHDSTLHQDLDGLGGANAPERGAAPGA
ncbi:MAG: squalene/phytoene synthase family protein [Planctomycetota bacterium]|nr:squalene/phytoene synthase family protein [Planctomycetota bacterium]MDG1984366.1 squalene/phytoene synthase family protein [Planctomycetota bacterium]